MFIVRIFGFFFNGFLLILFLNFIFFGGYFFIINLINIFIRDNILIIVGFRFTNIVFGICLLVLVLLKKVLNELFFFLIVLLFGICLFG